MGDDVIVSHNNSLGVKMKTLFRSNLLKLSLFLIVISALALGVAFSGSGASGQTPSASPSASPAATAAASSPLVGTISGMSGNSLTIMPVSGSAATVTWNSTTHFLLVGATSLQIGQMVVVSYNGSTSIADTVFVPVVQSIASPSASAAATSTAASSQTTASSSNNGQQINMSAGDTLAVTLNSNVTTGFSWQLDAISDPSVLAKVNSQYIAPASPIPGAGGSEVWNFKALKAGTSAILMEYSQPWAGGTKGAQTFSLTVVVK
jgi:inhibitor of cysteine peptidase